MPREIDTEREYFGGSDGLIIIICSSLDYKNILNIIEHDLYTTLHSTDFRCGVSA